MDDDGLSSLQGRHHLNGAIREIEMATTLSDLPEDVLRSKIFAEIRDLPDLLSLATACRTFRKLILELDVWRGARPLLCCVLL
jgi:hypothetical protein